MSTTSKNQFTDAADRELSAFGNEGREVGSYGSVSLRATADKISGVESSDVSVGLRYGTFDGVNGIDATAAFTYGTDEAVETTNKLQAGVDYRRDFNDTLFAYVKADLYFNKLADDAVLQLANPVILHRTSLLVQASATVSSTMQAHSGLSRLAQATVGTQSLALKQTKHLLLFLPTSSRA